MSSWSGQSKGSVLGYKIFVWTIKHAGLGPAYFILRFVSFYYFLFSWRSSASLFYYFNRRLRFNWIKSVISIYRNYYIFGQTLIDKVCVMAGYQNRFQYTCEGLEHLLGMVKDKKGGILISAHNGNWELAGHVLSIDAKINIVIYEGEHAKIKQYLSNVKKDNSVNLIVVNNNSFDHLYKINEALENHEFVCMHGDRFVEGSKTMTCQFLGEEARFPMGPFLLATQLQAPVSFVYAMKESAYHYHLFATKPVTYGYQSDRQQRNTQVTMALQNYVRSLEGMVQRFPTHWFNYYPFWQASTLKEEEKKDSFSRRRETAT